MKNIHYLILCAGTALLCAVSTPGYADANNPKVGVISFKSCLEQSKIGKQEQANFDAMKKQMESILLEKGKALEAIELKKKDADYMDSLSPEMETEFNRKARVLENEFMQLQNQYMQTLQQANMKIIQKLNDMITKAAKEIATEKKLDIVLSDESAYFFAPSLDISADAARKVDAMAEKEPKDKADKATP